MWLAATMQGFEPFHIRSLAMNKQEMAGTWLQIRGKVKEAWGRLTHDDLRQLEGHAEQLAGKLQERYGLVRELAESKAKELCKRLNWS
jgi:uncharacterized protein YjbJ (UPF0337 family)